jgi:hypothetical protein
MSSSSNAVTGIARAESPARAMVYAGGLDTCYVRAGRGAAIVIVSPDLESPETREMVETLSRHYLVFAAAPPLIDAAMLARWLHDFIEGLGMGDAHVLLHPAASSLVSVR